MWYAVLFIFILGTHDIKITEPQFTSEEKCWEYVDKEAFPYIKYFHDYRIHESALIGACFRKDYSKGSKI